MAASPDAPGSETRLALRALHQRHALQGIQDAVAAALGVGAVVRDSDGTRVTRVSGGREECGAVARDRCALRSPQGVEARNDETLHCAACGARVVVRPIRLDGVRVADWVCCLYEPPGGLEVASEARTARVAELAEQLARGIAAIIRSNLRHAREAALRQRQRAFLDAIINAVADPLFVKDAEHRWVILNDAFCRFMGYPRDALLGRSDHDFFPAEEARVFWEKDDRVFETEAENVNEERFTDSEGVRHIISTKKRVFRDEDGGKVLVGVIRDITEIRSAEEELRRYRGHLEELVDARTRELQATNDRLREVLEERRRAEEQARAMEAQLRHQQRLESIGRLAGGIAHDFNNLLTGITGHVSLALPSLPADHAAADSLREIMRAARRAADLTRQLLAFGRKQVIAPRVVDVSELVSNLRKLLERVIGEDVRLVTRSGPGPLCARLDPGQLEQVVVNLAVNSRDAMPGGGELVIETARVHLDEEACRSRPELLPGDYVTLTVTDSGCGMAPEVLRRAFEPFFTTKPAGLGTGLGLATVYGIVQQHGGAVEAESEPGRGTSVSILLPASDEPASDVRRAEKREAIPLGRETVLLVEDEELVREVSRVMLAQLGYEVLECASAEQALALSATRSEPIHLLMTDVVMPGMHGRQLAELLTAERPECRVLFTSGYTREIILDRGVLAEGTSFLPKPFTQETLARTVRGVLDEPPTGVPPTAPRRD